MKRKKNKLLINHQYELVPLNNAKRKLVFLFAKILIFRIRESIYLLNTCNMKKTSLLLIAIFVMTLCGCQSEPVQQLTTENETLKEVTTEKQEAKEEVVYLDDENAGFVQGDIVRAPMSIEEADTLKSKNKHSEDLVAGNFSKYLIVEIAVVNQGTEKAMWFSSDVSEVIDSKGRKYNVLSEATSEIYLDDLITFVDLKPSIPVVGKVVYEVAKDSEGFYYETEDKTFKVMLQNRNENNE